MAKYQYQIRTNEFEYIMGEIETDYPEAAVEAYKALREAYTEKPGLAPKELDLIIEKMCLGVTVEGGTELWSKATQAQKDQINCLKRALKRIESKQQ
jgi:hypothetical protein